MSKIDEAIRNFVLSEGKFKEPSLKSYVQALEESISKMVGRSLGEARRIEIAKEQLRGVRRHIRKLEEHMSLLEGENRQLQEQVKVLEENKLKEEKEKEKE